MFRFSSLIKIFRRKKEFIDVELLEIPIVLDAINSVGDYERKRMEIALIISCFYINSRNEYKLEDSISIEYWLFLADKYLENHGFNSSIIHNVPETVSDIFCKAKLVGFNDALKGVDEKLYEAVFENLAKAISTSISSDEENEYYDYHFAQQERMREWKLRERLRNRIK